VTSLDVAGLLLVASRTLDLDLQAVLALTDLDAAEAVLAQTQRCRSRDPVDRAAVLLHGLVRRRAFGERSAEVAVMAALQLLALNGQEICDLGPPQQVGELVTGIATGRLATDELAAWLASRLRPAARPTTAFGRLLAQRSGPVDPSELEGRMFKRFTDRARRVVVLAQEEARHLEHNYIGTEHLLLGLLHEDQGIAAKTLEQLGISLEAVRGQVEEIIGRGSTAPAGHIPFTPRAKKVLELSLREAKRLKHNYIGTEHLLLALVREGEGVAAQVLVGLGADLPRVREQVLGLLAEGNQEAAAALARTRLVHMTVPDDLRQLEEEIARVRRQKETAIDAQDFITATALRDVEKQLLARKLEREQEWTAGVDVQAVIAENQRVHRELERLRELLRQHGIEPNGGNARTA
jgi:Clp amino terminal domain, pathogenicity island component